LHHSGRGDIQEELLVPNYEYQCTECEHRFEIWQSVGEAPPACPECGSVVKKIFHPIRTIYKGSGFYITDSRPANTGASSESKSEKAETPVAAPAATPAASDSSAPAKTP